MDRRKLITSIGLCAAALCVTRRTGSAAGERPQISITIDDFSIDDTPTLSGAARNRAILDALDEHRVKAAAFVTGRNVDNEQDLPLLRLWDERGHMIANHTYSHHSYPDTDFERFTRDVLRNEALLKQFSHFRKFFRFPYLKEGANARQRDRMRAFLRNERYRNGHVTVDASDWYIDGRLRKRLVNEPRADVTPYRDFYLNHMRERAIYYDGLARKVLGRTVKHTLLIHHNVLNGLFLADLLRMFAREGWQLIDAAQAYADPVFMREPRAVPAGESLIWALAKAGRRFGGGLRYPAEAGDYERPRMDALGL